MEPLPTCFTAKPKTTDLPPSSGHSKGVRAARQHDGIIEMPGACWASKVLSRSGEAHWSFGELQQSPKPGPWRTVQGDNIVPHAVYQPQNKSLQETWDHWRKSWLSSRTSQVFYPKRAEEDSAADSSKNWRVPGSSYLHMGDQRVERKQQELWLTDCTKR